MGQTGNTREGEGNVHLIFIPSTKVYSNTMVCLSFHASRPNTFVDKEYRSCEDC